MEKIWFDDTTFIWKTKLNLFDNKNEIIKQTKRVIKSNADSVNDGFSYLKMKNNENSFLKNIIHNNFIIEKNIIYKNII